MEHIKILYMMFIKFAYISNTRLEFGIYSKSENDVTLVVERLLNVITRLMIHNI